MTSRFELETYTRPVGSEDAQRLDVLDEVYAPFTEALLNELALPEHCRAVDVGCGAGHMCVRLAQRFGRGHITGIDASPAQIEVAQARLQRAGVVNVSLSVGTAYAAEQPTGAFDLVFCRAVLWSLQRPLATLAEMRRMLKPGGSLLCEDFASLSAPGDQVPEALGRFHERIASKLGVDYNIGLKLPELFQAVGIANPQMRFHQPSVQDGPGKCFLECTYTAQMPFLIELGHAAPEDIEPLLAALRRLTDDVSYPVPQFRMIQVWGRG